MEKSQRRKWMWFWLAGVVQEVEYGLSGPKIVPFNVSIEFHKHAPHLGVSVELKAREFWCSCLLILIRPGSIPGQGTTSIGVGEMSHV